MERIQSEGKFVLRQFGFLVRLPWLLILILLKKRDTEELKKQAHEAFAFFFEPKLVITLILLNCGVFIFQVLQPKELWESYIFTPADVFNLNPLPIISSMFLHASVAHLAGNMLTLYIMGRVAEKHFGALKTAIIYFGAGIIATIVSALAGQGGLGASGAIAGIIASAILIAPFYLTFLVMGIPIPIVVVGWLAIMADVRGILFPDPADNIGHFAHLGGYLAITLLVYVLNTEEREKMKKGLLVNILCLLTFLLL